MKTAKIISTCLLALGILPASATILTVDVNPLNNAQFGSFPEAHGAASDGDTILLQPSSATYGDIYISKSITLIGRSHNQTGNLGTKIGLLYIQVSNVRVQALRVESYAVIQAGNGSIISNCYINNYLNINGGSGHIITGNVLYGFIAVNGALSDVLILNNYIQNNPNNPYGTDYRVLLATGNSSTVYRNNIFYQVGDYPLFATNAKDFTAFDNIFISENTDMFDPAACVNCIFSSNLTWSPNGTMLELPYSTMNNVAPTWNETELGFDYGDDYHMLSGTPLTGASDGGQVGIHGGIYENIFRYDGSARGIPLVTTTMITTPVVLANGQIQIQFEAEAGTE